MDLPHTENYQKTVETVAMLRKNCRKELELALKKPNSKFLNSFIRLILFLIIYPNKNYY